MIAEMKIGDRPIPGFVILIGATLLILGGAYSEQADLVRAGLVLLAFGAVLVPNVIRRNWTMKVAFCALAIIGVFVALTT